MTAELAGLRDMLRGQKVFPAWMPVFDPDTAPDDPVTLFLRWLEAAIQAGVQAPHAMTLATADGRGQPSSRVLICKDVDTEGRWYFASSTASGKGRDLAVNPGAALSFWWPQQGRQIRVGGAAGRSRRASRPASRPASWPGRPPPGREVQGGSVNPSSSLCSGECLAAAQPDARRGVPGLAAGHQRGSEARRPANSTGPSARRTPGSSPTPSWWLPPGPSTR